MLSKYFYFQMILLINLGFLVLNLTHLFFLLVNSDPFGPLKAAAYSWLSISAFFATCEISRRPGNPLLLDGKHGAFHERDD